MNGGGTPMTSQRSAGRWGICIAAAMTTVLGSCGSTASAATPPLATYHADNSLTGYSTDTTITSANVSQLTQKWARQETRSISAQATVSDGVVYWGDWNCIEHATTMSGKTL